MGIGDRLQHAWNAFINNKDPTATQQFNIGQSYYRRPDRVRFTRGNERTIMASLYNRIAIDVSRLEFRHVRLDDQGRFNSYIKDGLDECLTTEANIDQSGAALIQDAVMSMLDEGVVALVPVDTTDNPTITGGFDVNSLRTGQIIQWYPKHVKVKVYNDRKGEKEEIILPKKMVAIVENPLYAVVNEPNSTMQRLVRKLALLDAVDEQSGSGKLDLIIQLPYSVKTDAKRQRAEDRRKDIEDQLSGSKYGIAYVDSTERITQLNRSLENNLLKQIEYLTSMLYSQLGMSQAVLDGTCDEKTQLNYTNRIIKPIVSALVDGMKRAFLTKTARTQGQSIMAFYNHFEFATLADITNAADVLCRNEIASSNEIRQELGWKPSDDPHADQLRNSNMPHPDDGYYDDPNAYGDNSYVEEGNQNGEIT